MYDRIAIVNLVEDAERNDPYCACGAPMIAQERDGALWLACSSQREPAERREGVLGRIRSLASLAWHDRRLLLDAAELQAA